MSAAPRFPDDSGLAGLRMNARDYLALGETRERYELVDGVVFMSPSPLPLHAKAIRLIQRQLEHHADGTPGLEFFSEVDLRLGVTLVYRPDLMCYRPGRLQTLTVAIETPPDLVIEILSPGTKSFDLTTKRADYEKFGVGEYWAFDPADGRLRAYVRNGDLLIETNVGGDSFAASSLPGFVLDLKPLRAIG